MDDETASLQGDESLLLQLVEDDGHIESGLMDDVSEVCHLDLHLLPAFRTNGVGEDELDDFMAHRVVWIVAEEPLRLLVFVAGDVHEVNLDDVARHELVEHHVLVNRQSGTFCGEGVGA